MTYVVRFTGRARDDLKRLYGYLLDRDEQAAIRAYEAITQAISILERFPFSCRKAASENTFLRELIIPFGSAGYVALFEIDDDKTVTLLALRHQREDDYH